MNIAFLSSAFLRGMKESTGITITSLARELIGGKHRVLIITERRKGYPEFEKIGGVPVYRIFSGKLLAHARGVKAVQKKLDMQFDVIHGFSAAPVLALRTFLARKLYARNTTTIHTLKSYPKGFEGFAWLLNLVDFVTVPTEIMKKKIAARWVHEEKIHVVRSFIDLDRFRAKNKTTLKKKYGFKNKKIVFYYGSLYEKKGVKYLLHAFPEVLQKYPDAVLVLAPRHYVTDEYFALIDELGLKDKVKIITEDIDVADYVNLADVVVLPYVDMIGTEGNPSCLLESVACKTPVVTTEQPELKEIFDEDEVFYAKPADADSLADKIRSVLGSPDIAQKHAERAFKKIKAFDIKKIASQFLALYQKPLRER